MKRLISVVMLVTLFSMSSFSQEKFKYIFVPHIRSENATGAMINPGIAKIDFTRYSIKMLGGDLTKSTDNTANLKYCDSIFNLKSDSTLWTLGNHDVETNNLAVVEAFTGKKSYRSYARNGITWMLLNTELDAESFSRTWIKSPQLDTMKAVCDRITRENTQFFFVQHSRYMWMINNPFFTSKYLDSIAASSKSMDTTNWYSEIMPLLRKVKAKGIPVYVFGGDKSQINVTYSPEDSITFYAARMENTFTDNVNNVIVIDHVKNTSVTCRYVTLVNVNKEEAVANKSNVAAHPLINQDVTLTIRQIPGLREIAVDAISAKQLQIFSINGEFCQTIELNSDGRKIVHVANPGAYVVRALSANTMVVKNIIVK